MLVVTSRMWVSTVYTEAWWGVRWGDGEVAGRQCRRILPQNTSTPRSSGCRVWYKPWECVSLRHIACYSPVGLRGWLSLFNLWVSCHSSHGHRDRSHHRAELIMRGSQVRSSGEERLFPRTGSAWFYCLLQIYSRGYRNKMGNIVWLGVLGYKLPEQMAVGVGAGIIKSHRFPSAMQHEGDRLGTVWGRAVPAPSLPITRWQTQGMGTYKSKAMQKCF